MKRAFLFSGQGAQYIGMGKELYDQYTVAKEVFEEASDCLGYDMTSLCFQNNEQLNQTEYTQPAILTVNHAFYQIVKTQGLLPDVVAGLSLGEYNALISNGSLMFDEAVKLVSKRGRYMAESVPKGSGKMVAVLNAEVSMIETICKQVSNEINQTVVPANYNTPEQIVIGGDVRAVDLAVDRLKENGVKRCLTLNVSGPFHTPLLKHASEKLEKELQTIAFFQSSIPLISNTTGKVMEDSQRKDLLTRQVMEPVRFYESIATIRQMGISNFVEIGPGKVLSGFLKKIDKEIQSHRIEDVKTLNETLAYFN